MNKRCKNCREEFESYKNRRYCKKCKKFSNSSTMRMIRNREFIKSYKKDKRCELCGYNKYPEILQFHHKDRNLKNEGVNVLMKTLKNLDLIKSEIKKCIILCPNCHNELHLKEKINISIWKKEILQSN